MADEPEPIYFYTRSMPYWGMSNFAPPGFERDGAYWPTIEHYFQAQKFPDPAAREKVRTAPTPNAARTLGQSRDFRIRSDWDDVRMSVMLDALRAKFSQRQARDLLLSTGMRPLAEASPFDYFWRTGQDGSGANMLGELLMQVRGELAHGS